MHLQLVQATSDTRQLDDIVTAFTAPMRRVCPHLAEAALREMIQRMALQQLADEQLRIGATLHRPMRALVSRHRYGARRLAIA